MSWWESDGAQAAMAGAAGGIARWLTLQTNWKQGVSAIFAGGLCALYLGPVVTPLMEPVIGPIAPGGDATGLASFLVGLGALSLTGFLIDVLTRVTKGKPPDDQ